MGYLGNLLAVLPDYRDFDVVVAHGDSLLLGFLGKPVLRVMHGSARGEAQSARSWGRRILHTASISRSSRPPPCSAASSRSARTRGATTRPSHM